MAPTVVKPPVRTIVGAGDHVTTVADTVKRVLRDIPPHVTVVAAAKGGSAELIRDAIEAGVAVIGQNYFAEARRAKPLVPYAASWHFLGRLRPHDIRPGNLAIFDVLQSVDSVELAARIDAKCASTGRVLPVFLEVNSAREPQKAGLYPEDVETALRRIAPLSHLRVTGLMTMGPLTGAPEDSRPYFAETRRLYDHIRQLAIPGISLETLSMGMSDTYLIAIEEGSTMVRLGTRLFGPRQQ